VDRKKAYQLLGIMPGDSLETAKAKYRIKVKQCHPDLFGYDPKLMKAAEIEMTQINIAYQVACTHLKSNPKVWGINQGTGQTRLLIPWDVWVHWSIKLGKPLLQTVAELWDSWTVPGPKQDPPDTPGQERHCTKNLHRHENLKKKNFDEILQKKVSEMKKKRKNH